VEQSEQELNARGGGGRAATATMISVLVCQLKNRESLTSREDKLTTHTVRPVSMSKAEHIPASVSPMMSGGATTISTMEERCMERNSLISPGLSGG
jgi:hypothetical protein